MVGDFWQTIVFGLSKRDSLTETATVNVLIAIFSVPRINCLDCLDRTNVMMARISEAFVYEVADRISKVGISR
jgi:hypothetical protein